MHRLPGVGFLFTALPPPRLSRWPVGVLETLPSKLADRAPPFCGRSALEELMASKDSGAWVRLTELVLGPVPEGFKFLPKHKANATAAATSADAEANG